jgi:hypothetical protein
MKKSENKMFTLAQRQLFRLREYNCLEQGFAEHLADLGYITLFKAGMDLDSSMYPYQFGNAGIVKLKFCEWTDEGLAALALAEKSNPSLAKTILDSFVPPTSWIIPEPIVFIEQCAIQMVEEGHRDSLVVFNLGPKSFDISQTDEVEG